MAEKIITASNTLALLGCMVAMDIYGIETGSTVLGIFLLVFGCFLYASSTVRRALEYK